MPWRESTYSQTSIRPGTPASALVTLACELRTTRALNVPYGPEYPGGSQDLGAYGRYRKEPYESFGGEVMQIAA